MKVLLTVFASMMIAGSAMAACDKPQECTTESDCKALEKNGSKYSFDDKRAVKCMLVDPSVATKCVEGDDSGRQTASKSGDTAVKSDTSKGTGTSGR